MRVRDLMTTTVCGIEPETTLQQAAGLMRRFDVGVLPVLDRRHIVGLVTDRDLTTKGLAAGLPADAPVSFVMTPDVHACSADEDIAEVLLDMEMLQVRRMPVENDDDEFVGMLSLSDLLANCTDAEIGRALRNICRGSDQPVRSGVATMA